MREILEKLKRGEITIDEAELSIKEHVNLGVFGLANFDIHREERTGIPEVVLAEGKNSEHLLKIIDSVVKKKKKVIITRLGNEQIEKIRDFATSYNYEMKYNDLARVCVVKVSGLDCLDGGQEDKKAKVAIITAGTSDIPVAEEARMIAEELGCKVFSEYDVGVAGIHRTFAALERLKKEGVHVYIVAAGREGALPTLIAGIVEGPVIGVPVSVGYGIAQRGEAALHAMLQSCSPLVVVNIDAGFVAGAVAAQIAKRIVKGC